MCCTRKDFYASLKSNKKYVSCLASQNKFYKISFPRGNINFRSYKNKTLNSYIVQKSDSNIKTILDSLLPAGAYEIYHNNFGYSIKIKPDGQKYFLEKKITSQTQAVKQAKLILDKFFLADTNNSSLRKDTSELSVRFYKLLDGLPDYSFINEVIFDKNYNLKQINYNDVRYKKIGNSKIKSLNQAINDLPKNFPAGTKINLTSCRLIYMYSDSIIQPVYMFSGVANNNNQELSFIVKASIY